VHLASVFDHEVVSFALKHRAGLGGTRWVAAIGAVNMFNPGGAVLHFTVTTYGGEGGGGGGGGGEVGLEVRARFLGAGAYVLVTNAVALSKGMAYFILIALLGGAVANGLFLSVSLT
jgi:hypothetical protein